MNDNKLEEPADNNLEPPLPGSQPAVTFQGNNYDLMAVVGVTLGGAVLISCFTLNMGYYCLPVAAIVLGAIGLSTAKDSVNPDRTRLLSWLSIGSGAIILALILLFIALYVILIVFAIAADSGGF